MIQLSAMAEAECVAMRAVQNESKRSYHHDHDHNTSSSEGSTGLEELTPDGDGDGG